jgi:hypothetical protein
MAPKGKADKDYMLELSGRYTIASTPPLLFLLPAASIPCNVY